ncbi:MAG: hypothetical protein AAFV90_04365 [Cyanobacteria bacterium J06634_5]
MSSLSSDAANSSSDANSSSVSASLALPPLDNAAAISQRHEVNPALALNLLADIQTNVVTWQAQLRGLVISIDGTHAQGPMVDGWLESSADINSRSVAVATPEATLLRHGDTEALMRYVKALEGHERSGHNLGVQLGGDLGDRRAGSTGDNCAGDSRGAGRGANPSASPVGASSHHGEATEYWLRTLDDDGTVRSQVCPPEQIAVVSVAIARYQKYKQLVAQKEAIEAKLQQAVDLLTGVRSALQSDKAT